MGSPDDEEGRETNEGPVHQVCLKSFEMGKFEVTQAEWRRVMVLVPYPSYFKGDERRPVDSVSWQGAQSFVWAMSHFGHHHYRLPTEAEWEYAARAGTTTARYWGERVDDGCEYENLADLSLKKVFPDFLTAYVNCDDHVVTLAPVGSYKPNPFGLYDMLGNVSEWVQDCYTDNYRNAPNDGSAAVIPDCTKRVIRGGSAGNLPRVDRAAARRADSPLVISFIIGFRVARTESP
jgi:formylglycine-generating enzyme required for sulfatase activity